MATQPAPQNLDPGALLEAAPEEEFALIELRLDWPPNLDIYPEHMQLWLRCFVITADPLGWIPDRGEAWTAVTVDDDVLEVDLYLTVSAVRAAMEDCDGDMAAAVGRYAGTVMAAALAREEELISGDYPRLAARGETARLLADLDGDHGAFARPAIQARRSWSPVGLGALTDLVQHAFGAVDLDRSNVTLDPGRARDRGLPGVPGPAVRLPVEPRGRQGVAVRAAPGGGEARQHRAHRPCAAVEPRRLARDRQGRHAHQQAARADLRPAAAARRRRDARAQRPVLLRQRQEVQAVPRRMSDAAPLTGGCLCGARALRARRARRTSPATATARAASGRTGTAASAQAYVDGDALRFVQGEELVQGWRHPDGGMEKCFCRVCGGHLGSRDPETKVCGAVRMSAFDGDPGVRPSLRAFVAYAASWEPIPDDGLERFDGPRG